MALSKKDLLAKANELGITGLTDKLTVKEITDAIIAAGGTVEDEDDAAPENANDAPVEVTFMSKYNSHRVGITPSYREVINGIPINHDGISAVFEKGVLRTSDPVIIDALRKHPDYNRVFYEKALKK